MLQIILSSVGEHKSHKRQNVVYINVAISETFIKSKMNHTHEGASVKAEYLNSLETYKSGQMNMYHKL